MYELAKVRAPSAKDAKLREAREIIVEAEREVATWPEWKRRQFELLSKPQT